MVVDLIATLFMIILVLAIALTLITRGRLRNGTLPRPDLVLPGQPFLEPVQDFVAG